MSTTIDAPPSVVWEEVRHIGRHVGWMADAEEIRFTSRSREGVGTTFDCATRVGPFRLEDRMEVVDWRAGRRIGVRHVGLVRGDGRFSLRRARRGRTWFTWDERLHYPWWMGGPIGGVVGDVVLGRIWAANLRRLKAIVETGRP